MRETRPRLARGQPGAAALLCAALDPLVATGTLAAAVAAFGGRFDGACLILALLVFAMTFPGTLARYSGSAGELMLDIVAGWAAIVALLVLLGLATQTLGVFDPHAVLAWSLATPAALFSAHRLMPLFLPRVLNSEGLRKVAVIAGANDLGRRLATRLAEHPLGGVPVAGFFDARAPERIPLLAAAQTLGSLSRLADYARANRVDVIYIALPMASQPRILKLLEELRDTTASIYFVPDIFVSDLIQARVDSIGDLPLVAVCETPFTGFNGVVKRVSDIVLSICILTMIFPLLILIASGWRTPPPGRGAFNHPASAA